MDIKNLQIMLHLHNLNVGNRLGLCQLDVVKLLPIAFLTQYLHLCANYKDYPMNMNTVYAIFYNFSLHQRLMLCLNNYITCFFGYLAACS